MVNLRVTSGATPTYLFAAVRFDLKLPDRHANVLSTPAGFLSCKLKNSSALVDLILTNYSGNRFHNKTLMFEKGAGKINLLTIVLPHSDCFPQ